MKTPATFTDEELKLIDKAIDISISAAIVYAKNDDYKKLKALIEKVWAQIHGTEATDVEGV